MGKPTTGGKVGRPTAAAASEKAKQAANASALQPSITSMLKGVAHAVGNAISGQCSPPPPRQPYVAPAENVPINPFFLGSSSSGSSSSSSSSSDLLVTIQQVVEEKRVKKCIRELTARPHPNLFFQRGTMIWNDKSGNSRHGFCWPKPEDYNEAAILVYDPVLMFPEHPVFTGKKYCPCPKCGWNFSEFSFLFPRGGN